MNSQRVFLSEHEERKQIKIRLNLGVILLLWMKMYNELNEGGRDADT